MGKPVWLGQDPGLHQHRRSVNNESLRIELHGPKPAFANENEMT